MSGKYHSECISREKYRANEQRWSAQHDADDALLAVAVDIQPLAVELTLSGSGQSA